MPKSFLGLFFFALSFASFAQANAPSANGVQLGNVWVPRDRFVVFFLIGHCNMMGQAKYPEEGFHPRAWQLDLNQRPPRWVPAVSRNSYNRLGAPTLPFLQTLAAAYPDYHFGVVNNATSAACVHSNYRRGKSNYTQMVSVARALKPHAKLGGVATMMGYMEAQNTAQTRNFGENLFAMTQEIRADIGEPNLPFFFTQYELGALKKGSGWTTIANAIEQMPQHIPNSAVISTANFVYDSDHHPSYNSFRLWAARAAQAVNALSAPQWNVPPADTSPPKFAVPSLPKTQRSPAAQPALVQRPSTSIHAPEDRATQLAKTSVTTPPQVVAEVEAVLIKVSSAPNPRQIAPYKEAVASAQFEIKHVLAGHLDTRRVLAMRLVIEKGQLLPAANLKAGATYRLKLGTWNSLPRYHSYPMSDEIMDFESPIYFIHRAEPVATL